MDDPKPPVTTAIAIRIADPANPVELQQWIDSNPNAAIEKFVISGSMFYILYT